MNKEVDELVAHGTWQPVLRTSLPPGTRVLPTMWAFRIKRFLDGSINKFKARFSVRGDLQVAGLDLYTRQVDFSNAFVQSDMPPDDVLYIEPPKGYYKSDVVLLLKKSLYGTCQAPRYWFLKISSALRARGFEHSQSDECMFIRKSDGMILLLYVDDLIAFHRDADALEQFLDEIQQEFKITREKYKEETDRDIYQYLGIEVGISKITTTHRFIELKQILLIQKILKAVSMTDCSPKDSPATEKCLGTDKNGKRFQEHGSTVRWLECFFTLLTPVWISSSLSTNVPDLLTPLGHPTRRL